MKFPPSIISAKCDILASAVPFVVPSFLRRAGSNLEDKVVGCSIFLRLADLMAIQSRKIAHSKRRPWAVPDLYLTFFDVTDRAIPLDFDRLGISSHYLK